jgi:heat shock protein HslJ
MINKMSTYLKLLSGLLLLQMASACGNEQAGNPVELAGTFWALTDMPGELPAGVTINIQFEDTRMAGKGVCNRYFSDYLMDGNKISFKAIGATEMMCMEHSDIEVKYFQTLEKAETVEIVNDQLTIKTPNGDLVFAPAEPPAES